MTKEEEKETARQLAERTTDMSFDREAELKNGATIKSVRGGIVSVSSAKPKNRQASASGKVMKATVPTERTISNEDMMNDFASALSDTDF